MSYIIIYLVLILLYNYVSWIEFTCLFPRTVRAALWSSYRKWSQTARLCPWFVEPFWDMTAGFWAHPQGSDWQHRRSPCRWPACTVWSDRCISLYSPRLSGQRSVRNYWNLYYHFTSVNKKPHVAGSIVSEEMGKLNVLTFIQSQIFQRYKLMDQHNLRLLYWQVTVQVHIS